VPASCVSPALPAAPRSSKEPINFLRLRQNPPPVYLLGPRDVLGIYIEGVLGRREEAPPVHFPAPGEENLPPSIGYPIPVREDGTISLPLVPPIQVGGLTMAQVEEEIRVAYMVRQQILQPGAQRILVTLMKPRTYSVLVVREDMSMLGGLRPTDQYTQGRLGAPTLGTTKFGATHLVELPAYQNDVLHALSQGGGLPGLDAQNEVLVLHGGLNRAGQAGPAPSDPNSLRAMWEESDPILNDPKSWNALWENNPNVTRIPLRIGPNEPPLQLTEEDIILNTGDIVYIRGREAEVFYTGGLLQGGQYPVPRDYDLDVLGAIAMAGGSVAAAPGGTGSQALNGGRGVGSIFPPTRVIVVRTINGQQIPIRLNLKKALLDPKERILVQPNDYIMLQYTEMELAMNMLLNSISLTYSLNGIGGGG
jgi:protein involved in polysaccharide export with SLBB domain